MGDFAAAAAAGNASASTSTDANAASLEAARAKHQQSLRAMAESLSVARETAHALSMQSEQLDRSERAVEETKQVVDMSKRILRGMTWSGWLYNAVSSAPQPTTDRDTSQSGEIAMGFICPECRIKFKSPEQLGSHYAKTHEFIVQANDTLRNGSRDRDTDRAMDQSTATAPAAAAAGASATAQSARSDVHEDFLRALEPQLAELKEVSLALGNALDMQNRQLERIDEKVDAVQDDMKRVSLHAKKLTGGQIGVHFRFRCALQEVESGKFLRDVDGEALLGADIVADGCTFRAYTLGDGTERWGFQSERSSLFFGVNRYGNLKVKGEDLRSYEQFVIDHTKVATTVLCVSSFFGLGGWITRRVDDNQLKIIRGTPENKAQAARFKLVRLEDDTAQSSATRR